MSKSSFFKRSVKLAGLATKVAAKEVGLRASKLISDKTKEELLTQLARVQQAELITKNLSQLKGAAMKAGQLLSIDSSEFLPKEALEILSRLQSLAEAEDYREIERVLKRELQENFDKITDIEEKPLASASIGQVHKCLYRGQALVLKVQYPGIEESIDSDIKLLEKLVGLFLLPTHKKIDFSGTFEELRFVLHLEANYLHEIEVLDFVYKQTLDDSFFSAPKPYHDLSTEKVLAMEYCEGVTLNQWIQTNPGVGSRRIVGVKLLDHFVREFLEWNVVQTDPNFGNFLVQEDPLKVILLDFGSTLRYSKEFIDEYKKTILVAQSGDVDKTFEQAVAFGLLDAREGQDVRQHFLLMMQLSIEPFVSMDQPFDFSSLDYERRSRAAVLNFTKSLKFSPPPRKIIFLHRKLGGLFNLMKRLDVQIDLRPYWQQIFSPDQKT